MCLWVYFHLHVCLKVFLHFLFPFHTYCDFLDSMTAHAEIRSLGYGILRACREIEQ